ncbi:MAG: S8 family serine peptidase [Candidatus Thorarchaeota archaeon]
MLRYLEPYPYPYEPKRSSSNNLKLIAIVVIFMIIVSGGFILILPRGGSIAPVNVAIIDSGIDLDFSLADRVTNQTSFVSTDYGYQTPDPSVTDSTPDNVPHGTIIAKEIAALSPNAVILNAKILGPSGAATARGLVAAIHWAVELNSSVINISLGSLPTFGDPLKEAIAWAFAQGVVVVAAAGNEGEDLIAGNQVNSPASIEECIAVGALNEFGSPASYTSPGPTAFRYMKPDLSARGHYDVGNTRYSGTSFAAPRVTAAAAELISFCIANGIAYTAGSIIAALLKGANGLPHPEYVVGAGEVNLQNSKQVISSASVNGSLPAITYVHPRVLPIDYEKLFYGDTYNFTIQIFTSGLATFDIAIDSDEPSMFELPSVATINQSGQVPLTIHIPSTGPTRYENHISFTSTDFGIATLSVDFDMSAAVARVAFDISYTTWSIDTTYGQFRDFYKVLTKNDISVTEIRNESDISLSYLQQFDAVVLLDPFAWDINETDPANSEVFSLPFGSTAKQAYQDYYGAGGGVFVAALSNESLNVARLNNFIDWSGYSFDFDEISDNIDPVEVTQVTPHTITSNVGSFDFLGARLSTTPAGSVALGRYMGFTVLSGQQGAGGGRLVVTGTNFFIDNWGINGLYSSSHNDVLALQIVDWISDLI